MEDYVTDLMTNSPLIQRIVYDSPQVKNPSYTLLCIDYMCCRDV
jgi:hypothetical protein